MLAGPIGETAGSSLACRWCLLLPPYVRAARSVCWATTGSGGDFVHALKYGGWTRLSRQLAERMIRLHFPADVVTERTAVVAVPLARERQRERGYNQSELLARPVAGAWGVPVWDDVLVRVRATSTQTRLAPEARALNVTGAFAVPEHAAQRVRGGHVVLVDDVVTTCATLNECAAALYSAGARLISYLTFARAPAASDRA
jgi:ComF family protein